MNIERNDSFTGLCIPLAAHRATSAEAVELTEKDMSGLEGVSPLYRAMRTTFKNKLGNPHLVGPEIRMALLSDEGGIPYTAAQVLDDLLLTAAQVQANAKLEQPLPLSRVASHMGMCKVLNALSAANRKSGTRLLVRTDDGCAEAPILEPGDFVEPVREDVLSQTGTFKITGLFRDAESRQFGLLLTRSRVLVLLPLEDPLWNWGNIKNSLDEPSHLVGTIIRTCKSSDWMPASDARVESQQELEGIQVETA